ncbi:DNA excision repair protein ERCC-1 [Astathelohania contejeani]|uniref:DNA excision repair protein ERCC-1 n=1 Tax=Astathelohania contejeani TaxID=164912 RepID=A0ABQ7HYM9_9MICR|nr:DNA excision repair protein ERCC-1 [Thelohania contejeani]
MLKVSDLQTGNGVLEYLKYIPWVYSKDLSCDYEIHDTIGVLFLSIQFHCTKPEYIHKRFKKIKLKYNLRILLVLVDAKNPETCIEELFSIATKNNFTMLLAYSNEEAGKYIHSLVVGRRNTRKKKEIQNEKQDFLKAFPHISTTDSEHLSQAFENIISLIDCDIKYLKNIPGIGKKKAELIKKIFEEDFIK